jgi:intergrase/recombinase
MEPLCEPKEQVATAWKNWKCFTIKIKPEELPVLNQRLKIYGFNTTTELIKDFIAGKFPVITEDRQIQAHGANLQSNGLKTAILTGPRDPTFYLEVDLIKMTEYLTSIRRLQPHYANSLTSYFRRYRDVFFGPDPSQILELTPHRRMWILQAVRNFASYYLYRTGNHECRELVEKIIGRYSLSAGWDRQKKIYVVDGGFIEDKVHKLLATQGDVGILVKFALFSGLRQTELSYVHDLEVCNDQSGCSCSKLHVVKKEGGLVVILINWIRKNKKTYFCIAPERAWERFRGLMTVGGSDFHIADQIVRKCAEVRFTDLRKIVFTVNISKMEPHEADILAGRARSTAARYYILFELDKMAGKYAQAWSKYGGYANLA